MSCPTLMSDFSVTSTGFNVDVTDLSTGSPISWNWDFGNGTTSNLQAPGTQVYPNVDSTYLISLTVVNACGDSSTATDSVTILSVGIDEFSIGSLISVSPNPSNGLFTINLSDYDKGELTITVFDQLGKVISNQTLNGSDQKNNHLIDLTTQETGIYFLRFSSVDGVATKKIVVQ